MDEQAEIERRSMECEETECTQTDETLTVSIASELPYLRKFGYEILAIDETNCDLSWAKSGNMPVILEHRQEDPDALIGVVQDAWIENKKVYAKIKFSTDPARQGVINDIRNGVRRNFSIGYRITGKVQTGSIAGVNAYRCSFKIWELSQVLVPADTNIGIGRQSSNELFFNQTKEVNTMTPEEIAALEAAKAEEQRSAQPQPADAADVIDFCRKFGMDDKASELVRSKKPMNDVKEFVLAEVEKRSLSTPVFTPGQAPAVHVKQERSFSIGNAVRAAAMGDWSQAGYEREMSQEWGKDSVRGGFSGNNFFLDPFMSVRAATVAGAGTGAELVGTDHRPQNLIELLYAKTISDKVGVTKMQGLTGHASIPKIISGAQPAASAETSHATAANFGTGKVSLSPNAVTAETRFSRQLAIQSAPSIEAIIMNDLYKQIARKVDEYMISGSGASNQPLGVLGQSGVSIVAAGTNGGAATWSILNNLIKSVDNSNALEGSLKFVGNPKVSAHLRTTLKDTNTAAQYLMGESNTLVGYDYVASTLVPSNLVKGTSGAVCSPLIFGNWADLIVAQWGAIEIELDRFTGASAGEIVIRAFSYWDTDVKHGESFAAVKDLLA